MDATPPAETASRLDRLVTLRRTIENTLAGGEPIPVRDFSALSREYRAVMAEIEALAPPDEKGDAVDEIARRRAARRTRSTAGAGRAKQSG